MFNLVRRSREQEGFTLIELLVVVLIIGVLAAIAVPVFFGQADSARQSAVETSASQGYRSAQAELTVGGSAQEALSKLNQGSSSVVSRFLDPVTGVTIASPSEPGNLMCVESSWPGQSNSARFGDCDDLPDAPAPGEGGETPGGETPGGETPGDPTSFVTANRAEIGVTSANSLEFSAPYTQGDGTFPWAEEASSPSEAEVDSVVASYNGETIDLPNSDADSLGWLAGYYMPTPGNYLVWIEVDDSNPFMGDVQSAGVSPMDFINGGQLTVSIDGIESNVMRLAVTPENFITPGGGGPSQPDLTPAPDAVYVTATADEGGLTFDRRLEIDRSGRDESVLQYFEDNLPLMRSEKYLEREIVNFNTDRDWLTWTAADIEVRNSAGDVIFESDEGEASAEKVFNDQLYKDYYYFGLHIDEPFSGAESSLIGGEVHFTIDGELHIFEISEAMVIS